MRFKVDCPLKIVKTLTPFQSSFCPPSLRGSERAVPSNVRKARLRFWAEWRGFLLFSQQGTSPPPEVLNTEQGRKIGLIVNDGWLYAWKLQEDPVPRVLTFQSHPSTENVSRKDNGHGLLFLVLKNFPLRNDPSMWEEKLETLSFPEMRMSWCRWWIRLWKDTKGGWPEKSCKYTEDTLAEGGQARLWWLCTAPGFMCPEGGRKELTYDHVSGSWIHEFKPDPTL